MRKALVFFNGQEHRVDLDTYLRLQQSNPEVLEKGPRCPSCGSDVFAWDKKGAKGFRVVRAEVTEHDFGKIRPLPGFHHYPHDPNAKDCPLYYAHDPKFQDLHSANHFYVEDKARNLDALSHTGTREVLDYVQEYLMQRLTGLPVIEPQMRGQLDKIERTLVTMSGLHAYPWVMGYLPPVLLGSINRTFNKKRRPVFRVEYKKYDWQNLPFEGSDGIKRNLVIPKRLELCFSRYDGKDPKPWINDESEAVSVEVTRPDAVKIVKYVRSMRHKPEQLRLPLVA